MRRIIERTVTVVTTTTWTIYWKDDPLHPSSKADPVHPAEFKTEDLSTAQLTSPVIEIKEADTTIEENPVDPNNQSKDLHSYPSKVERK